MTESFGEHVHVTTDGAVAVVTVDRPPYNHITAALLSHLADALEAVDRDDGLRAAVLRAEGKSFCAGADFGGGDDVLADGDAINPIYLQALRLFATAKPIIAAVQGAAVGAGLGLALAADFRIAAPEARFAANFVSIGFHPGFALTYTLPRLVGQQRAELMFLTGRRITLPGA